MFDRKSTKVILPLFITFIFVISAAAIVPVRASSVKTDASSTLSISGRHAPISGMGQAALSRLQFGAQNTPLSRVVSPSPLNDLTPAGSIRFVNDSSYILQSETSVAVDPNNPRHVVGTFNDGRYFFCPALASSVCPSGWTYSLSGFTTSADGGHTVSKSSDIPSLTVSEYNPSTHSHFNSLVVSWGDPSVVAAPNGLFYYASLAIDPVTGVSGVMIAVSNSSLWGSSACTTPNAAPTSNPCWTAAWVYGNTTLGAPNLEDKELGAVDWSSSAYYGDLFLSWDHFNLAAGVSATYAARCTITLSCVMISTGANPISGTDPFVAWSTPQVGADGTVYVSWCNFGTATTIGPVSCRVASSPAGGGSFGAPSTVLSFMGSGSTFPTYSAIEGFATEQFRTASIGVIAADGSNSNNLYFTIAVCTSGAYYLLPTYHGIPLPPDYPGSCGASGVLFASSNNKGATWSTPQVISTPAVNIQPWVTVDAGTGQVVVTYLTSQFDPFDHRIDVVAQISNNGGSTWSTKRLTPVSNEPNADPAMYDTRNDVIDSGFGGSLVVPQFGDYIQSAVVHGTIYTLYTASYVPEQGTYKASPFLAVNPSTAPHLVLAPGQTKVPGDPVTQGSPGETVPFNATGFTPNSPFSLWLNWGGLTVSLANGTVNSKGVAAGSFVVPNIQSQVYSVTASDNNGVSASATFGIGQLNLAPLQASIASLSSTLSTDFTSLSGAISSLGTSLTSSLNGAVTSIQGSISSTNSSLSKSMGSGFATVNAAVAALGAQVTAAQNSIGSFSSTLTNTEYLVVIAIIVAIITLVVVLIRKPKP